MPIRQREYRIAGFRFFFSRLSFFFLLSRRNNGGLLRQTVYAVNNTVTLLLLIIAVIVGAGTNEEKLCSNVRHDSLAIQTSSIELHYVQSVTFLDCFCCCCLPWWRVRPSRYRAITLFVFRCSSSKGKASDADENWDRDVNTCIPSDIGGIETA